MTVLVGLWAEETRSVDPLILPVWHQTDPWNGRCPGPANNRAHAGSHALALAKTMKYWAYPTYGTGSVSYVDDDYGPINQVFTNELAWNNMSNTLVFQTTLRYIFLCGAAVYTDYEQSYSTSSLVNIQSALTNFFLYDPAMQYRSRSENTNFYWKSMIRAELDAARPVIYAVEMSNGTEVAFLVDGYNDEGLFHVNWSNVNYPDSWVDLNLLTVNGQLIPNDDQYMLTGVRPSQGPENIDENFETDFSNFNWQFSGQANWTISTEAAYFGTRSAKSGNINDNQTTSLFIQINVTQADTISFYKKVSCEAEPNNLYDHLAFLIDGVEQERWSGDGQWQYHEYPVSAGVHEFRWTYNKDGASDYFGDCAWVDAVDLPEGTTPLNPPLFVEAEFAGDNDIQLNWSPPQGTNPTLQGYKVYRNGVVLLQYSNPNMTSYVDYNLPNGDYTYHVRAVYTEGVSGPSNSTTLTVEVPYAPTNLTASLVGVNTANLQWQAPPMLRNRVLMGYQVYRDNVLIGQVENPDDLDYQDTGLAEGVYFYEVSAMWQVGESARSNIAQLAVGVPEPPSNLQAVVSGNTVTLSWNQVPEVEFLTGFKVFRNGIPIATISNPTTLGYVDAGLPNGAYSYYVRAVYSDVESGNSSTVNVLVEVPYPPVNVVATVNGDDVVITWSNPETVRSLTHYFIYRNGQIIAAVFNPNTTIYTDLNLPNGIYTYRLSAVYSGVESPLSEPVVALVEVLYPPTSLSATVNLADVSLQWTLPVNQGGLTRALNGFNVYRDEVLAAFLPGSTVHSYTQYNVPNGLYSYKVTAVYGTGESAAATVNDVLVEVLYPVTILNAVVNDDDVQLSWTAAATSPGRELTVPRSFLHYAVYRDDVQITQTTELTYTDADLANGIYQYYVTAIYGSGASIPSPVATVEVEVPYPPTGLSAIVSGDDVSLAWNAPVNSGGLGRALLGYRIYRDGALLNTSLQTAYTDSNLPNGLYEYQVYAVYANSVSQPSNTVQALVEVLYPPTNLSRTVTSHNDVTLHWLAASTSGGLRTFMGYQVYRNDVLLGVTTELTHSDPDLADGHYDYYIRASYDTGVSDPSNTVHAFIEYPYPPVNLTANVVDDDVSLSWDAVAGTGVQYRLHRDGALIAVVMGTTYQDTNLANGTYEYFVQTQNASDSGISDPSTIATATVDVPYPPRDLSGSVNGDNVELQWTAPATGPRSFVNYKVYRDGVLIGSSTLLAFTDTALANGTYSYYVTAQYDLAESLPSNTVVLMMEVLYPPTALTHTVDGDDVTLSWTAAVNSGGLRDIQGYRIFRDGIQIALTNATTYNDLNLANGIYQYYVQAEYINGVSTPTNTVTAIVEVLYPPSGLSYVTDDDNVVLSWQAAATSGGLRGFQGYNAYRDGALLTTIAGTTYTDMDLSNGIYQYYVTALYDSGESTQSNTVTVNLEVLYPAAGLIAIVNGDDVSLSWSAAASSGGLRSLIGYKVLRDGVQIAQTALLAYQDTNLANGIYQYQIVAAYDSGDSEPTPSVEVLVEVLYAPSGLTYVVNGDAVMLTWTAAANSARAFTGYNVYRDGLIIATSALTAYTDAGLANGTYQYYVTAQYGTGESGPSNTVSATVEVLYPASNLTYSVVDDDVTLSWTAAPTSGGLRAFQGYAVFRDGSLIANTSAITYNDMNLANGTYQYYVVAMYDAGSSAPTNTVTVLVEVLYPPTALTHVVDGDDVTLSWTAAVSSGGLRDIQGYRIFRDGIQIALTNATTYNDLNLANGIYQYYVQAEYINGVSTPTNTVTAIVEVLYPPSGLSYVTDDDNVVLSWQAAATSGGLRGFQGYNVYRDGALLTTIAGITYTDMDLPNGIYQYYVTALYDSGESTQSNTVTVNLEVLYPAAGLIAIVNGDDVSLSWSAAASSGGLRSLIGYKVLRDGVQIAQTALLAYQDTNLANGIYQYQIVAAYDSGDSEPTPSVEVLVEVLYAPSGLTYVVNGDAVMLTWTAAANSARAFTGYNVYRDGLIIATSALTAYTDAGLANGTYQYYVTAQYGTGESGPSNTVSATVEVLYPASNLTYSVVDDDVTLSWTAAPTSGGLRSFQGYAIYRDGSLIGNTTQLSYSDMNLANGIYQYYVTAMYDAGTATPTNTVTVMLEVLYPPTALVSIVISDDVSLSWTASLSSGGLRAIQGYQIFRDGVQIASTTDTSYNDLNLANGVYQYYVQAEYLTGVSTPSNTVTAIVEVLYQPSGLTASVNGDDVSLQWIIPPISGRAFTAYKIYRNGQYLAQTTTPQYADLDLANGTYSYYVTAQYDAGESLPTNTETVAIEVLYGVTNLTAQVNEDTVLLSWTIPATAPQRAFLGYFIYRNNALREVLSDPSQSTWTDPGLANGEYSYYLVAIYGSGLSLPSNVVTVNINVMPNLPAPSGLIATLSGERDVLLSWNEPAPNVQSYLLYRNGILIATLTDPLYSDLNLPNGSYSYYVKAQYAEGVSSASETAIVNIMIASPPTNLSANVQSGNNVALSWTLPLQGEIGLIIYRNGSELVFLTDPNQISYLDQNLPNGSYTYQVAAVYLGVISNPGNSANVLINVPYIPQNLTHIVNGNAVTLSWQVPSDTGGLTGYNVYRDNGFLAQTSDIQYTESNLPNGSYQYHVTAIYGPVESGPTTVVTANIGIANPPSMLTASVNGNSVQLNWIAITDLGGFIAYDVWRNGVDIADATVPAYTDSDLPNGNYSYQITARYTFGSSNPTNTQSVTVEVLYAPSALSYNVVDNDVFLSWNAAPNNSSPRSFLGYKVYRGTEQIAFVSGTNHTDPDLPNGSYSYYVVASYSSGDSAPTNTVIVLMEVLYPAANLTYMVTGDDVVLSWNAVPASGATLQFYKVYRNGLMIAQTSQTTYNDLTLANGDYAYWVTAQYTSGESLPTNTVNVTMEITYAVNSLAYTVENDDVTLTWNPPPNSNRAILGYRIYRNDALIVTQTQIGYQDMNLANGNYYYYIIVVYDAGLSSPSNTVTAPVFVTYPPTNLMADYQGVNNVLLNWTAPNQMELGYLIYRNDVHVATISDPGTTSYLDSLLPNALYTYYVVAQYPLAVSPPSNTATIDITTPYPPRDLVAIPTGSQINYGWLPPLETYGLHHYWVYITRNGEQFMLEEIPSTQTTFQVQNLSNATYAAWITSIYGASNVQSAPSNTQTTTIMIPYAPTGVTAQIQNENSVYVEWTAPDQLETGFLVFRNDMQIAAITNPETTNYMDNDLANGSYSYYVKAVYGIVNSAASNTASITIVIPYPPQNLTVDVSGSNVVMTWGLPVDTGGLSDFYISYYLDGVLSWSETRPATTTTHTQSLANGSWDIDVKAIFQPGNLMSGPSNLAHADILMAYPPSELTGEVTGNDIALTWAAPTDPGGLTSYTVYRNDAVLATINQLTYSDADLPNGSYTYSVSANYGTQQSAPSNEVAFDVTIAYSPTNLVGITEDVSVNLTWTPITDMFQFITYTVQRDGAAVATTSGSSFTDTDLPNGAYQYTVRAQYAFGESAPTDPYNATINHAYAPQDLQISVLANDVTLTWDQPADTFNLDNYGIYRGGEFLAETTQTTFTDADLPNGAYTYHVVARYGSIPSDPTPTVTAHVEVFYTPSDLVANVDGDTVQLTWNAVIDPGFLQHYKVYRGTEVIATPVDLAYFDIDLDNGSYSYSVKAVYLSGESAATETANAVILVPYEPRNLLASAVDYSIHLTWEAPGHSAIPDHYSIWYLFEDQQDTPDDWRFLATVDSVTTVMLTIEGGYLEGRYVFAMLASYGELDSPIVFSNTVEMVAPTPPPPTVNKLVGNYPNPFNPNTRIVFWLKETSTVKLTIYNERGQQVRALYKATLAAGEYVVPWDGKDDNGRVVSSGVFFCRMTGKGINKVHKMLLLK
jgi:hypothetical protein